MRALLRAAVLGSGLCGLWSATALAGGFPKVPKAAKAPVEVPADVPADVPSLNVSMSVSGMLAALDDAARKLEKSADTLFDSQMALLEALGKTDLVLEYRAKVAALEAEAASEERAAEMVAITTDAELLAAIIAALTDKQNVLDAERKLQARDATVHIMLARLMAAATSEDAGLIGAATVDMSKRVSDGDETLLNDIAQHSDDPKKFIADARGRAQRIAQSARGFVTQSKAVSEVMDKYRAKNKLFDEIRVEEPRALFEQSGF